MCNLGKVDKEITTIGKYDVYYKKDHNKKDNKVV